MSPFELDPRLVADSDLVAHGPLSQLRLMDDMRFPWLLLVPRRPGASELIDLAEPEQRALLGEIRLASAMLRSAHRCDKLNIALLGNIVAQLHVHVVARTRDDECWPGPVWGAGTVRRAGTGSKGARIEAMREGLDQGFWRIPGDDDPD